MKKTFLVPLMTIAVAVLSLTSCIKNNDDAQCNGLSLDQEKHIIDSFANDHSIGGAWITDKSFYAKLTNPEEGNVPTSTDSVSVSVRITLLDGTQIIKDTLTTSNGSKTIPFSAFSQNTDTPEYYAVSQMKENGQMMLILPSIYPYYAWGCQGGKDATGMQVVPPNAQVIYTYTLYKITPVATTN